MNPPGLPAIPPPGSHTGRYPGRHGDFLNPSQIDRIAVPGRILELQTHKEATMNHNVASDLGETVPAETERGGNRRKWLFRVIAAVACLLAANSVSGQIPGSPFDQGVLFDEISNLVSEKFWDEGFGGLDWQATASGWRERAARATSHDGFADAVNGLLGELKTSHTRYFPATDPKHYQLLGVFDFVAPDDHPERFTYDGIGIDTKIVDGKVFVSAVFDGLPADKAGLKFGDEIVSVDSAPFHPVESFHGRAGQDGELSIRRTAGGPLQTVKVTVAALNGRTMFEDAMDSSARIIERDGKKIGYVHLWSYAGIKYHDRLQQLVLWGKLSQCDSLIVDFRDGWGGANLDYVNLFREPLVEIESLGRVRQPASFTGVWGKPVALLINAGSTSGKELYAFAFRKHKLGTIVGATSAGAVVAGQCIPLSNGDVLYLAVTDLRVDGQRLEGVGVPPDHPVGRPLPYANGTDPQLDKAVELLAR